MIAKAPPAMINSPNPATESAPVLPAALERANTRFQAGLQTRRLDEFGRRSEERWRCDLWHHAGFPPLHTEKSCEMFDAQGPWRDELDRLLDQADMLIAEPTVAGRVAIGVLFALIGGRGGGKTQLATCVGHYHVMAGKTCRYTTAQRLFRDVRAAFHDRNKSEQSIVDAMTSPSLLVIDEVHDRASSDFEARLLNAIIDERYCRGRLTLLLSNETTDRFVESIGPTIASRFEEAGEIIATNWPSFRRR